VRLAVVPPRPPSEHWSRHGGGGLYDYRLRRPPIVDNGGGAVRPSNVPPSHPTSGCQGARVKRHVERNEFLATCPRQPGRPAKQPHASKFAVEADVWPQTDRVHVLPPHDAAVWQRRGRASPSPEFLMPPHALRQTLTPPSYHVVQPPALPVSWPTYLVPSGRPTAFSPQP